MSQTSGSKESVKPRTGGVRVRNTQYLTPTQKRLTKLLADGLPHPIAELIACLPDPEVSDGKRLYPHITYLRKKLGSSQDIRSWKSDGVLFYMQVSIVPLQTTSATPAN